MGAKQEASGYTILVQDIPVNLDNGTSSPANIGPLQYMYKLTVEVFQTLFGRSLDELAVSGASPEAHLSQVPLVALLHSKSVRVQDRFVVIHTGMGTRCILSSTSTEPQPVHVCCHS